jgi:hypothetical protein
MLTPHHDAFCAAQAVEFTEASNKKTQVHNNISLQYRSPKSSGLYAMLLDCKQAAIGNGYSLGNDLAPVRAACPRACGLCTSDFTMTVQMKVYDLDGT